MWYARGSKVACVVLFTVFLTPAALMVFSIGKGIADVVREHKKNKK